MTDQPMKILNKTDNPQNKITILTLGDHPFHLSGVAHCLRDIIKSLIDTGKFRVVSLGAAIQHQDHAPMKVSDDWVIIPVDGFGTAEQVAQLCKNNSVDLILMQSDPRFYDWFLCRDNEIRPNVPVVWYSVWDNYPYPVFNDWVWNSVDVVVAISQLTEDLVKNVAPDVDLYYQPHCVNSDVFRPYSQEEVQAFKKKHLAQIGDRFVVYWNNRNGRRKNGASLVVWFKSFLDKVGADKAVLFMHTDPVDPNGFNLPELIAGFDLQGKVFINPHKIEEEQMAMMYNVADVTVNISNAEGFGMSTLESLSCGTPIVAAWTGGLREQLCDDIDNPTEWYGAPVFPISKTIVGSPELPWIMEENVDEDAFVNQLLTVYNMTKDEREDWGRAGRLHVEKKFNFKNQFCKFWPELMLKLHKTYGSRPNRNFVPWTVEEVTGQKKYDSLKKPYDLPLSAYISISTFEKWLRNKTS